MLGRRALSSGRIAALGATLDFHHGLPGGARLVSLLARTCDATARGRRSSTNGWRRPSSATDVTQFVPAPSATPRSPCGAGSARNARTLPRRGCAWDSSQRQYELAEDSS